jgi:hypothetical protein
MRPIAYSGICEFNFFEIYWQEMFPTEEFQTSTQPPNLEGHIVSEALLP